MKENVTLSAWRKRATRLFPLAGKNCYRCGTDKALGNHHMDFNPTNNNRRNLRTLCASCHTKWHWRHGKLPWNQKAATA